jgi:VWFA-related protein
MLLAVFAAALTRAQDLPPPPPLPPVVEEPQEQTVIRGGVEMISIMATVRGKRDAIVTTLEPADFHIFEDGKEQQIRGFSRETDLPLTIALLIDASQSMDGYFRDEQRVAARFFERVLRPGDQAMVAAFRIETELLQDMTDDQDLLRRGLNRLNRPLPPATGTVLYDALAVAAEKRLANQPGRKVMVVLSDWADYGSKKSLKQALDAAHKAEAMVYGIAFDLDRNMATMFGGEANNAMSTMTEKTGGRLFRATTGADLDKIFAQIEEEVRSQYSISYSSSNPVHDGKYRKIQIKMSKGEYKVQTREGYFARKE